MRPLELLLDSFDRVIPLLGYPELARRWTDVSVLVD
jgi:hypothetical protein